jgi:putative Holliday junction resolvase
MGLDLGTKTIGVAVSDELGFTGQGHSTIRRTNLKADFEALLAIVREYGIEKVVLGLPLNLDGSEGPRAEATRKFGVTLEERLQLTVIYWDERLTTIAAERSLREANLSSEKRKARIDQVAASLILQGWLDSQAPRTSFPDAD